MNQAHISLNRFFLRVFVLARGLSFLKGSGNDPRTHTKQLRTAKAQSTWAGEERR